MPFKEFKTWPWARPAEFKAWTVEVKNGYQGYRQIYIHKELPYSKHTNLWYRY
jgi:hypothetical protein